MKFIAVISLLLTAACGFQPLYATNQNDATILDAGIEILPIEDREGQILRNRLLEIINPTGQPKQTDYKLSSKISKSTSSLGVQADETTTLNLSRVSVSFVLTGEKDSFKFSIKRKSSYSESDNAYATSVAEEDAIRRNLEEIAADAKLRIATYLSSKE